MKRGTRKLLFVILSLAMCGGLLSGCDRTQKSENTEHEPLTILSGFLQYEQLERLSREKYPEVRLEYISYTGSNTTGYLQYLLQNGSPSDIMPLTVFGIPEAQKEYLLDLSGFSFLNEYKTADINQVTLDGGVYAVPMSSNLVGLYYNKTMFAEHGWEAPQNFEELKALTHTIREAGVDPCAAQFFYPGNGFFDLFTMAKTNFLSTPEGLQWERDFKAGNATAKAGLSEAAGLLQELIDCGFLDADDTLYDDQETTDRFFSREAAMYLSSGMLPRFTQNEDGTGDQYGIMPFYGAGEDDTVLISTPLCYFGLSKTLGEPGNEQKLEDALKIMELLATEEGQKSLSVKAKDYIAPLKNEVIQENSPFNDVSSTILDGHTSNLAYAGYEPIIIDVGDKVRDWVAGRCTGEDVLALMDQLQSDYLSGSLPPVAVAAQDFTVEQTAQMQAESFRLAAGTDIGLVSLGAYHTGVENHSGVCGRLFAGDITQEVANAIVPGNYRDPICILTLTGAEVKGLLESGFAVAEDVEGFSYIPSGVTVTRKHDGSVKQITLEDGTPLDESASYTVSVDQGGFTEEIGQKGSVKKTELVVVDVVSEYLHAHSPLSPLEPWEK